MKKNAFLILLVLLPQLMLAQSFSSPDQNNSVGGGMGFSTDQSHGIVEFNVPFFSYSNNGADLGIGIRYQTGGVLVNQYASNVGLGWDMYAGGSIKREIRGVMADEKLPNPPNLPLRYYSDVVHNNITYTPYFSDGTLVKTIDVVAGADAGYWWGCPAHRTDQECDIFYLTLGNSRRLKFMFSYTGEVITIPANNGLKIERFLDDFPISDSTIGPWNSWFSDPSVTHEYALSFVVTDEKGNKFYFARSKWDDQKTTYEWALTKFTSYEGQTVSYYYSDPFTTNEMETGGQVWQEKNENYGSKIGYRVIDQFKNIYLDRIVYPNGLAVNLNYHTSLRFDYGYKSLDEIVIYETNAPASPVVKKFKLKHTYFISPPAHTSFDPSNYTTWNSHISESSINYVDEHQSPSSTSISFDRYRLKLDQIINVGMDGTSEREYYTFDYSKVPLPPFGNGGRDKYGYSNGALPQHYASPMGTYCPPEDMSEPCWMYLYIPLHNLNPTTIVGMDQSIASNEAFISACLLNKVVNEIGGVTTLTYKSNKSLGLDVGGVSVVAITHNAGYSDENNTITNYAYENGEKTYAGEGDPVIFSAHESDYNPCVCIGGFYDWTNYMQGGNILNTGLNGSNFVYKTVTEENKNTAGVEISKVIYKFSGANATTASHGVPNCIRYSGHPFGVMPYSNKQYAVEWGIGLLLEKTTYDNNGHIILDDNYTYEIHDDMNSHFPCYHLFYYPYNMDGYPARWSGYRYSDQYNVFTGVALMTKSTSTHYFGSATLAAITRVVDYVYDGAPYYNISSFSYNNSMGERITEFYNYSYSYSTEPLWKAVGKMQHENLLTLLYKEKHKIIGTAEYVIGADISVPVIISGNIIRAKHIYKMNATSTPITAPLPINIANMESGENFDNFYYIGGVTKFDDLGYTIESSDNSGVGENTYSSSIIDNQTGGVLAIAKNARHDEIAYCGFESDYSFASEYNKGNIGFNLPGVSSIHMLGRASYKCSSSAGHTLWTTGVLSIGHKYVLSMWVKDGGAINANDGTSAVTLSVVDQYTTPATGEIWKLYKAEFTATSTGIGIWGEAYVDEVKLYPVDAMMTTANFINLIGKTADVDVNDQITTYEYDPFGNQTLTRNHNGNIILKKQTIVYGH